MKKELLFLILFSFLIVSCKKTEKVDYKTLNYSELFSYFIFCQDTIESEIIAQRLYDSVLIYQDRRLCLSETIDSNQKELKIHFEVLGTDYFDASIKERNVLVFAFDRYDSLKVEGQAVDSNYSIEKELKEFMTNPQNKENLPQKAYRVIELLDTVLVNKGFFMINALTVPDTVGNKSSWFEIRNLVNKILETTYSLRNEASLTQWNKKYNKLKLNQKIALSKYIPVMIWIYPNRQEELPPPPPPLEYFESNNQSDKLSGELTEIIMQQEEKE